MSGSSTSGTFVYRLFITKEMIRSLESGLVFCIICCRFSVVSKFSPPPPDLINVFSYCYGCFLKRATGRERKDRTVRKVVLVNLNLPYKPLLISSNLFIDSNFCSSFFQLLEQLKESCSHVSQIASILAFG